MSWSNIPSLLALLADALLFAQGVALIRKATFRRDDQPTQSLSVSPSMGSEEQIPAQVVQPAVEIVPAPPATVATQAIELPPPAGEPPSAVPVTTEAHVIEPASPTEETAPAMPVTVEAQVLELSSTDAPSVIDIPPASTAALPPSDPVPVVAGPREMGACQESDRFHYLLWLGRLTILLAAVGFVALVLIFTGQLVITPEFGKVIVQGRLALIGLCAILLGSAIGFGMSWHAAYLKSEFEGFSAPASPEKVTRRCWWLLCLGFLVGLSSIIQVLRLSSWIGGGINWLLESGDRPGRIGLLQDFRFQPINPADPQSLQIFAYDLRWPPLLVWLSICLIQSGALFLKKRWSPLSRWWIVTFFIGVQSITTFVLSPVSASNTIPLTLFFWPMFALIAALINAVLATRLVMRVPATRLKDFLANHPTITKLKDFLANHPTIRRWSFRVLTLVLAIGGMFLWGYVFVLLTDSVSDPSPGLAILLFFILLFGGPMLVLLGAGLYRLYLHLRGGDGKRTWMVLPHVNIDLHEVISLFAVVVMALSIVGLFYDVLGIGPIIPLIAFYLSWALLAQIIADDMPHGIFHGLRVASARQLAPDSAPRRSFKLARRRLLRSWVRLRRRLGRLVSVQSTPIMVFKLLIIIALLLAFTELPHTGKTIIQPFTTSGQNKADQDNAGQFVSDRLIADLGAINQLLRPDSILLSPGASGGVNIKFVTAGGEASGVDAVLAKSDDVTIAGVKIPPGLLVAPIQGPMRIVLGVRLISGSLQDDGDGYTLLAASNRGETWSAHFPAHDFARAVVSTTEELAFNIISTDPAFAAGGMTRSWKAFQAFKGGLQSWQRYEAVGDDRDLTAAIDQFRDATRQDRSFALAHYRLGLALQNVGDPDAAIDALRASVAANPNFVAGYNALAYTLFNYDDYSPAMRSAVLPLPPDPGTRAEEARRDWQEVLSFPADAVSASDRASAYYGLCLEAIDAGSRQSEVVESQLSQYAAAYFYCQRSELAYAEIPAALRSDQRVKQAEAAVLNTLGTAIVQLRATSNALPSLYPTARAAVERPTAPVGTQACMLAGQHGVDASDLPSSYALAAALRYFDQALALQPNNPIIRCNAASVAAALGIQERIRALKADSDANLRLAQEYRLLAKKYLYSDPTSYYNVALDMYGKAMTGDTPDIEALDGYAYTFWVWRLDQVRYDLKLLTAPDPDAGAVTLKLLWVKSAGRGMRPPPDISDMAVSDAKQAVERTVIHSINDSASTDNIKRYLDRQPHASIDRAIGQVIDHAIAKAIYGSVLLGELRFPEATQAISQAINFAAAVPVYDQIRGTAARSKLAALRLSLDELRWGLAQAYVCSGQTDKATQLLDQIRQNEADKGLNLFIANDLTGLTCMLSDSSYYHGALDNYQQRIEQNPRDTEALVGYAKAFWRWSIEASAFSSAKPEEAYAESAEKYAQQALELTGGQPADEVAAQSRLDEILLARHKFDEVIKKLELVKSQNSEDLADNRLRWELAQAYSCMDRNGEAWPLLDQIREEEADEVFQPFSKSNLLESTCIFASVSN